MKLKDFLHKTLECGLVGVLLAQAGLVSARTRPNVSFIYQIPAIRQQLSKKELRKYRLKRYKGEAPENRKKAYDLFIKLYQKNQLLAKELGKIPEFQNEVSSLEVKALEGIVKSAKDINFLGDFGKNQRDIHLGQLQHNILISWGYNGEKLAWNGYFPIGTQGHRRGTVFVLGAQPYEFETEDRIKNENIYPRVLVKWESQAGAGDIDGILTTIDAKKDEELTLQLRMDFSTFKIEDLYSEDLNLYDGQVKIRLIRSTVSENDSKVKILEDMVLLGIGKKYSPLLQALIWGFEDGIFNDKNPLNNYEGHMALIEKTWGNMKEPRWDNPTEVIQRLSSSCPQLISHYTANRIGYTRYQGDKKSNWQVIKSGIANCVDTSDLEVECLRNLGYPAGQLKVRPSHRITYYKDKGKIFIMDNGQGGPLGILGPFESFNEIPYDIKKILR